MFKSEMQIVVKSSVEAMEFYKDVFNAEEICVHFGSKKGTVDEAQINVFGQIILLAESTDVESITGNTMKFGLHFFEEGKENIVKKIYDKLKDGAKIIYPLSPCIFATLYVDLIDKYGVRWNLSACEE